MTDLCKRLQNVKEAGVYRLNCSLEDLRTSADDCRFDLFEANISRMRMAKARYWPNSRMRSRHRTGLGITGMH
jgi:hypothetical protein